MSFDSLLNDKVTLLKKNGEAYESIKASIQKDKIYINRLDLLIETGDLLREKFVKFGEFNL